MVEKGQQENQLRMFGDIGRRSTASTWVYAIAWPFIFLSTELHARFPSLVWLLEAFFMVSALLRTWHFRQLAALQVESMARWLVGLFPLSWMNIIIWGAIAGYALLHGSTELVFLMTISLVGFTAGGVNNFAPYLILCRGFLFCGVGPLLVATIIAGSSLAFLVITLMFLGYLLMASRHQHHEYWNQIANEQELKAQKVQLDRLSRIDALTGLFNRRHFNEKFEDYWLLCSRQAQPLSMLMLDIDHFKRINDVYGHAVGDACLQWISGCMQKRIQRSSDVLARMGGEEFAILLPFTDQQGALAVAEALRAEVANSAFQVAGQQLNVTVSIGVSSEVPQTHQRMSEMMVAADKALYQCKHQGRNRCALYQPESEQRVGDSSSQR